MPRSPRSRSCSWSKTVDEQSDKKTEDKENKSKECNEKEEESLTPKEKKRKEDVVTNEEKSTLVESSA